MDNRIKQIRESEKKSHIKMYSSDEIYQSGSWLNRPIKTIKDIIPIFQGYQKLRVLDLGCGVGRNSIFIAEEYKEIDCIVDCVDILELAIEKLSFNAEKYGVSEYIRGVVKPIEEYTIKENKYDFIIAVSALEHVETVESFLSKLEEIRDGICENGVVCLVMNSEVREKDKVTGEELPAQFEVNLKTKELQEILNWTFEGWTVLKTSVQEQQYDIPRESGICDLQTKVVSFVARK